MIHGRGSSSTYAPFGIREASATFVEEGAPGERNDAFPPLVQLGGRHRSPQAARLGAANRCGDRRRPRSHIRGGATRGRACDLSGRVSVYVYVYARASRPRRGNAPRTKRANSRPASPTRPRRSAVAGATARGLAVRRQHGQHQPGAVPPELGLGVLVDELPVSRERRIDAGVDRARRFGRHGDLPFEFPLLFIPAMRRAGREWEFSSAPVRTHRIRPWRGAETGPTGHAVVRFGAESGPRHGVIGASPPARKNPMKRGVIENSPIFGKESAEAPGRLGILPHRRPEPGG